MDASYELADGSRVVRATYAPGRLELSGYFVVAVADSVLPHPTALPKLTPERITTLVARFPRCILAELNTHRVFSRNSASSRARSIKVVISDVMEDPYVPIFTENQRGMGGPIVADGVQAAARIQWLKARDSAVASVLSMLLGREISVAELEGGNWRTLTDDYYQRVYLDRENIPGALNLHKQNVNRLLEPFMWHEAVITSTEWVNFLQLRDHDDADPAIHGLAKLVGAVLESSVPVARVLHAPFAGELVRELEATAHLLDGKELLRKSFEAANYSAGAAAQVSYRPVSDGGTGANPAKLASRLLAMAHLSPFEHAAFSTEWLRELGIQGALKSNLSEHWAQHRALIRELEESSGSSGLEAAMEALG